MKIVIVSGMSGAGKSSALHFLEDAEYFCVDNLQISLIKPFAEISMDGSSAEITKIALGIDIRSGDQLDRLEGILKELENNGVKFEILFLDASDETLIKRYKETRRTHPLAGPNGRVEDGIALERKKMAILKKKADYIIDTSQLFTHDLKKEISRIFIQDKTFKNLYITVLSFGYKYGIPTDADLVMDVRFLPNPYYVDTLRTLTGNDRPVRDYVMSYSQSREFLDKFDGLLNFLIPNYISEGKNQLIIAIGCTGGRHRSVVLANAIYENLSRNTDYGIRIEHRDIGRDPIRKQSEYEVR